MFFLILILYKNADTNYLKTPKNMVSYIMNIMLVEMIM